jgi:hypothetical protein
MSVYNAGRTTNNGNSQSEFLSGKKCAKSKKKSDLLHDPATWLRQRTGKYLYETCLGLMILPQREEGAMNPSKFKKRTELIDQLLLFAENPRSFRKNQEDHRQSSADREMGAYGYSDFTSVMYEEMRAKEKWHEEMGADGCDGEEEEEGVAEKKNDNSGKALPFITQEDDDLDDTNDEL